MTLTDRARRAAEQARRADPDGFDNRFADPGAWKTRARYTLALAGLLGIDPADVTVRDDPVRRYGTRYPVPLLHAADNGGDVTGGWWFIPETGDRESFLALGACPSCGGQVPVARIASIADLGDLIGSDLGPWDDPAAPASDRLPIEFDGDPGHRADCPHHDYRPGQQSESE